MNVQIKLTRQLLVNIRQDLPRSHPFAFERVGFILAGATHASDGNVILLAREYLPVSDADYIRTSAVGAMIGSAAIRKALEAAYAQKSSLLHVHSHGGLGLPDFSQVDLKGGDELMPGLFNALPQVPHGLIVLSDNSARGLMWVSSKCRPCHVHKFVQVGSPFTTFGRVT